MMSGELINHVESMFQDKSGEITEQALALLFGNYKTSTQDQFRPIEVSAFSSKNSHEYLWGGYKVKERQTILKIPIFEHEELGLILKLYPTRNGLSFVYISQNDLESGKAVEDLDLIRRMQQIAVHEFIHDWTFTEWCISQEFTEFIGELAISLANNQEVVSLLNDMLSGQLFSRWERSNKSKYEWAYDHTRKFRELIKNQVPENLWEEYDRYAHLNTLSEIIAFSLESLIPSTKLQHPEDGFLSKNYLVNVNFFLPNMLVYEQILDVVGDVTLPLSLPKIKKIEKLTKLISKELFT